MSFSQEFTLLENRLIYLKNEFIPAIREDGDYTQRELDNVRGYVLLVHAEIETYFESISKRISTESFAIWKESRARSRIILSLISFSEKTSESNEIVKRANDALTYHYGKIFLNNGIKDVNILSLFLPIGVEFQMIDSTWLTVISEFGKNRGEIAHKSIAVQRLLDPVTICSSVVQIIQGIKDLEQKLQEILNTGA